MEITRHRKRIASHTTYVFFIFVVVFLSACSKGSSSGTKVDDMLEGDDRAVVADPVASSPQPVPDISGNTEGSESQSSEHIDSETRLNYDLRVSPNTETFFDFFLHGLEQDQLSGFAFPVNPISRPKVFPLRHFPLPTCTERETCDESSDKSVQGENITTSSSANSDFVLYDGKRYFFVEKGVVNLVEMAGDAQDILGEPPDDIPAPRPPRIHVVTSTPNNVAMQEIAFIDLNHHSADVEGVFLHQAATGDVLAAISESRTYKRGPFSYINVKKTHVSFHDVTDPGKSLPLTFYEIEGELVLSRRVGHSLFVITQYLPNPDPAIEKLETVDPNSSGASDAAMLESLFPHIKGQDEAPASLIEPDKCFIPNESLDPTVTHSGNLLSITQFELTQGKRLQSYCVVGKYRVADVGTNILHLYNDAEPDRLHVQKLALSDTGLQYRGSAIIDGLADNYYLGAVDTDLVVIMNRDTLREGNKSSALYLIHESDDELALIAEEVPLNPGFSESFFGIDSQSLAANNLILNGSRSAISPKPHSYIINLDDVKPLKATHSTQLPDRYQWLYPLTDTVWLGIAGSELMNAENEAGLTLRLLDLSDQDNPLQLDELSVGKAGTHHSLFRDHKAFNAIKLEDGRIRFGFPITVYDGFQTPSIRKHSWRYHGLHVFEAQLNDEEPHLQMIGTAISSEPTSVGSREPSYEYQRAIMEKNRLHYVFDGTVDHIESGIMSFDWQQLDSPPALRPDELIENNIQISIQLPSLLENAPYYLSATLHAEFEPAQLLQAPVYSKADNPLVSNRKLKDLKANDVYHISGTIPIYAVPLPARMTLVVTLATSNVGFLGGIPDESDLVAVSEVSIDLDSRIIIEEPLEMLSVDELLLKSTVRTP